MSITIQRCSACAAGWFPDRYLCPACGSATLAPVEADRGVIASSTTTTDGVVVLTVDVEPGVSVVARLLGAGAAPPAGTEIELTDDRAVAGLGRVVAYVPSRTRADGGPDPRSLADALPLREATVPGILRHRAALTPDAPLFRREGLRRTAAQMTDAVARAAGALRARGVQPGDRVAMMAGNRTELLDLILGCGWLGAVAVPMNVAARGTQLHHVLGNCGARLLIIEEEYVEHVDALPPLPHEVRRWVLGEEPADMGEPVKAAEVRPGDPAAILYTSGTTGVSKGVVCPHAQFYWWGRNVSEQLGLTPDDVLHTCLPLFHTNALNAFSQAVVSGAEYSLGGRFSASRFWSEAIAVEATVTYLLGAMVSILDSRPPGALDRAHRVRIALSPATPARLVEAFGERFGVALLDGYGSTETNAVLATRPGEQRPGFVGRLQPGFSMRVVDEIGAEVPRGVAGELLVRSDQPFAFALGYHEMPDATAEAWRDLWFHTGDRVVLEDDGYVRFVDRIKDVIRRRGENISSVEVEEVIRSHPDVEEVAAYAVDSELGEDEVMVAVVGRGGTALDFAAVVEYCRPRLAAYAIPRFFRQLDALPLTENGKVRKPDLRRDGTAGAWDRDPPRGTPTPHTSAPVTGAEERTAHA
ncbi:ATP-dependent acyl-CoA ligase [Nocardioides sp. GXZ039]|uniref:ATP-dependent acyl-CoA ligase n=1 Tax=Nocardioides sp. GXZ039 TaxID=3136018 RepID=UPI0030F37CA0